MSYFEVWATTDNFFIFLTEFPVILLAKIKVKNKQHFILTFPLTELHRIEPTVDVQDEIHLEGLRLAVKSAHCNPQKENASLKHESTYCYIGGWGEVLGTAICDAATGMTHGRSADERKFIFAPRRSAPLADVIDGRPIALSIRDMRIYRRRTRTHTRARTDDTIAKSDTSLTHSPSRARFPLMCVIGTRDSYASCDRSLSTFHRGEKTVWLVTREVTYYPSRIVPLVRTIMAPS